MGKKPILLNQFGKPFKKESQPNVLASGYSNGAASLTNASLKGWDFGGGSADDDILTNLPIIRQRSRDLAMNAPIVAGLIQTITQNVVGSGLIPEPSPDAIFLKFSPEEAQNWKSQVMRLWRSFAESKECDAARRDNFYELTALVARSVYESGDTFVLMPMFERGGTLFDLRLQVIEADCISDPLYGETETQNDIYGGVEIGATGEPIAYHICTNHPLSRRVNMKSLGVNKWVRVPAYGDETGRKNILHLINSIRPNQRRGVPLTAPIIESMKVLDRYIKSELQASLIQSLFTVVISSDMPQEMATEDDDNYMDYRERYHMEHGEVALSPGIVQYAAEGETVTPVSPSRPYTGFDSFVQSMLKQVGAAVGVPYELLNMSFTASYSASRAAMNMATANFKTRRAWIVSDFCQPVYDAFMDEAVAKGYIYAPKYFENPLIKQAYRNANWNGPGYPQIDVLKEVQAAEARVKLGISTLAEVTAELTGGDWNDNIQIRGMEEEHIKRHGLKLDGIEENDGEFDKNKNFNTSYKKEK